MGASTSSSARYSLFVPRRAGPKKPPTVPVSSRTPPYRRVAFVLGTSPVKRGGSVSSTKSICLASSDLGGWVVGQTALIAGAAGRDCSSPARINHLRHRCASRCVCVSIAAAETWACCQ